VNFIKLRHSLELALIWLLLASLIFVAILNPDRAVFSGLGAFGVFLALSGADKFNLI
jgi:hypothetical protein